MSGFTEVVTRELTGKALDWTVAKSTEQEWPQIYEGKLYVNGSKKNALATEYHPTSNWDQLGQLVDGNGIEFKWLSDATIEAYSHTMSENRAIGYSHCEAACRLIALELGETVMVPTSLLK